MVCRVCGREDGLPTRVTSCCATPVHPACLQGHAAFAKASRKPLLCPVCKAPTLVSEPEPRALSPVQDPVTFEDDFDFVSSPGEILSDEEEQTETDLERQRVGESKEHCVAEDPVMVPSPPDDPMPRPEDRIGSLERENEVQIHEINALVSELTTMKEKNYNIEEKLARMLNDISSLKQSKSFLEKELDAHKRKAEDLVKQNAELVQSSTQLKKDLTSKSEHSVEEILRMSSEFEKKLDVLTSAKDIAVQSKEQAEAVLKRSTDKLQELEISDKSKSERIQELEKENRKLMTLQTELESVKLVLASAKQKEEEMLQVSRSSSTDKIEILRSLESKNEEIAVLKLELASLQPLRTEVLELKTALSEKNGHYAEEMARKDNEILKLKQNLSFMHDLECKLSDLKLLFDASQSRELELETEISSLADVQQRSDELVVENQELRSKLQEMEKTFTSFPSELQASIEKEQALNNLLAESAEELSRLEEENSLLQQEISNLGNVLSEADSQKIDIERLSRALFEAEKKLKDVNNSSKELSQQVELLNSKCSSDAERLSVLESDLIAARSEVVDQQEALARLQAVYDDVVSENSVLQSSLSEIQSNLAEHYEIAGQARELEQKVFELQESLALVREQLSSKEHELLVQAEVNLTQAKTLEESQSSVQAVLSEKQSLLDQVTVLSQELDSLRSQDTLLTYQIKEQKQQILDYNQTILEKDELILSLKNDMEAVETRYVDQSKSLQSRVEFLEQQNLKLKAAVKSFQSKLKSIQDESSEATKIKAQIIDLSSELSMARQDLESALLRENLLTVELESMQNKLQDALTREALFQEESFTQSELVASLTQKVKELSELPQVLEEVQKENEAFRERESSYFEQFAAQETELSLVKEKLETMDQLQNDLQNALSGSASARESVQSLTNRVAEYEALIQSLNQNISDLHQQLEGFDSLKLHTESTQKQVHDLEQEKKTLEEMVSNLSSNNLLLQQQFSDLQTSCGKEVEALSATVGNLEQQNAKLKSVVKSFQTKLAFQSGELEALQAEATESRSLRSSVDHLSDELEALVRSEAQLREQLLEYQALLNERNAQCDVLSESLLVFEKELGTSRETLQTSLIEKAQLAERMDLSSQEIPLLESLVEEQASQLSQFAILFNDYQEHMLSVLTLKDWVIFHSQSCDTECAVEIQKLITHLSALRHSLSSAMQSRTKEVADLKQAFSDALNENEALRSQVSSLSALVKEKSSQSSSSELANTDSMGKRSSEQLRAQSEWHNQEVKSLQDQLQSAHGRIVELEKSAAVYESEIVMSLRAELVNAQNDIQTLKEGRGPAASSAANLTEVQTQLKESHRKIAQLEMDLVAKDHELKDARRTPNGVGSETTSSFADSAEISSLFKEMESLSSQSSLFGFGSRWSKEDEPRSQLEATLQEFVFDEKTEAWLPVNKPRRRASGTARRRSSRKSLGDVVEALKSQVGLQSRELQEARLMLQHPSVSPPGPSFDFDVQKHRALEKLKRVVNKALDLSSDTVDRPCDEH